MEERLLSSQSSTDRSIVDRICETDPTATTYQTTDWWDLQEQVFGYKTFYVYVQSGSKYCLLPLSGVRGVPTTSRLTCLPLTQFCTPLYSDGEILEAAVRYAIRLKTEKHYSALVIKPRLQLPARASGLLESRWFYRDYRIDFRNKTLDSIWTQVSRSEKAKVRKAERASVEVRTSPNDGDIDELNSIMLHTTKRHNVPAYPKEMLLFFKDKMQGQTKIYFSRFEGRMTAGIVIFTLGAESIYGYSFALPEYFHLGSIPALLWRALTDSYNEGMRGFDLGAVSPADEGLSSFKARLGSVCEELPFYFEGASFEDLVFDPNSSARFLSKFYGFVPLRLHSFLGPRLLGRFG